VLAGFAQFERRDYVMRTEPGLMPSPPTRRGVPARVGAGGRGRRAPAIGAWRAAIVADAALVPAYLALIDGYLRLGQPSLARQVAQSGVRAVPDSVELRDRLLRLERRERSRAGLSWPRPGAGRPPPANLKVRLYPSTVAVAVQRTQMALEAFALILMHLTVPTSSTDASKPRSAPAPIVGRRRQAQGRSRAPGVVARCD
jgi:hypothetical protein